MDTSTTPPYQPAPTAPPIPKPAPVFVPVQRPSRIFWRIFIGVIILIAAAYVWMKLYPTSPVYQTPTASVSAIPTLNADATAAWKTYTNSQGIIFTIKYPSTWAVSLQTGNFGEKYVNINSASAKVGGVSIGWNSRYTPSTSPCPAGTVAETVQLKSRAVQMCYSPGSQQEPPSYQYSSIQNGAKYSLNMSYYPGAENREAMLKIFSTLELAQ